MPKLSILLNKIDKHNKAVYAKAGKGKINFDKCRKNWGSDVIPKSFWVDISKNYKTMNGKKVILHNIVLENSVGNEVTYPVKGTVITKRAGRKDLEEYHIWTLDGRANVCDNSPLSLVLSEE